MSGIKKLYETNGFNEIERKYGFHFEDKSLLIKAFIHSSFDFGINNNYQRLEFLGDAILQMIVSDYMYRFLPNDREGVMSKKRSSLVSETSLAYLIRKEGLDKYIIFGKSMINEGNTDSDSYVADVYESFIAAIYLDRGYDQAEEFVKRTLIKEWDKILDSEDNQDYKTKFQEIVQVNGAVSIQYKSVKTEEGFDAEVTLEGISVGRGFGKTKKKAEQNAAKDAIGKRAISK
ncbi:ribonuclease III [Mollicutes bacterium LVI A0078]|nr:ribonuclease III [Mollicutes bacterium LVI A0075]WOO90821.1 ribonuclease III [Mollicutes bacterium LVI A0078]